MGNFTFDKNKPLSERKRLTAEKLRKYKGYENVTDEEASQEIAFIETFARILFDVYKKEHKISE